MIPGFESTFDFDVAGVRLRELSTHIVNKLPGLAEPILIPADQVLSATGVQSDQPLYLVTEGCLRILDGERVLMTIEEGECVVVPPSPLVLMTPDFAARVRPVSAELLTEEPSLFVDLWRFFSDLWIAVTATVVRTAGDVLPRALVYGLGEIIIEQGTLGQDVYTLMEGEAEAFVDGILVGEIKTNEFFGVIAAVTNTPRTARVIAKTRCTVLAVSQDMFQELIKARPVLIEKLIVEMGRAIVDLNSRVVRLSQVPTQKA